MPYQSMRFSKTWDSPDFLSQVHTIRNARINNVGKKQSCMVPKSKTWDSPDFLSQVVELNERQESASHEHREILASSKFHRILTEYLTETLAGNARINDVGNYQSCMVSKLRIIWKQTVEGTAAGMGAGSGG